MSNIIDFEEYKKASKEPETWGYFLWSEKSIGVKSKLTELSIGQFEPEDSTTIALQFFDELLVCDRKEMAELLWAFAFYVDGEQEWLGGDYVSLKKDES